MFDKTAVMLCWTLASVRLLSAATYYVNSSTGNDTNAGTLASPWQTLNVSATKLNPGDTLNLTGTFAETAGWGASFEIYCSGTAGNPITIQGYGTGATLSVVAGSDFGTWDFHGNYLVFDHLKITDSAPVGYGGSIGLTDGHNNIVRNCECYNMSAALNGQGADHQWIFPVRANSCMFSNVFIHDIQDSDLWRVWGTNNLITHCVISNCTNPNYDYTGGPALHADLIQTFGTYGPMAAVSNIFECSIMMNCGNITTGLRGITGGTLESELSVSPNAATATSDWVYRNNIFVNNASGAIFDSCNRSHYYNNTFYNYYLALQICNDWFQNHIFENNVFINSGFQEPYGSSSQYVLVSNVCDAASQASAYTRSVSSPGFWNTFLVISDPGFANAAGGDFHLKSTSVLRGMGANLSADPSMSHADFEGKPRPSSGAWDVGAYQYGGGTATNPVISVTPASLLFQPVAIGASNDLTLAVQNAGGGTLAGSASVPPPFTIVSGGTYSLGSNQSQTVTVRYSPTVAGNDSRTVTFTGGGGATVSVSGSAWAVLSGLTFPSYAGTITEPFMTNGGYVSQSIETVDPEDGGSAIYGFNIRTAGNYTVSALVNAPDASAKSFFVNIDADPTDPEMIWDISPFTSGFESRTVSWRGDGTYTNDQFVPAVFNLSVGTHTLMVRGREANVGLGAITIAFCPPPVVSPITQSGADVDPNTLGLQIYAGSAVQYSGTASDPNGLALTWQWIYTVNGGAETLVQSGAGVVASVSYNYTASTAGNTYLWKLRVSNGYATAESDLAVEVEAPPAGTSGLTFQAAAGSITAPFVITNGDLYQPTQILDTTNSGCAAYPFTVANAGNYVIQALVNAPDDSANSFYVNVDAEPQDPTMIWDIPVTAGFEQRLVSWRGNGAPDNDQFVPQMFALAAGTHQVIIRGREANTQLRSLSILRLPSPPQHLRVVLAP